MKSTAILALGALAGISAQPSPQPAPLAKCIVSSNGATYDLTSLSAESGFQVQDNRNNDDATMWDYWLSICNNMQPPTPACQQTCGDDGKCQTGPAPVFQVCQDSTRCNNVCHRLGDTAANAQIQAFPWNPSHGVSVLYTGGDACSTPKDGMVPRSASLDFICYDASGLLPSKDAVIEDTTCRYHFLIYSKAGCPQECPFGVLPGQRGSGHLCAGAGICDYDSSIGQARCFCDQGYSGTDCTTLGSSGNAPTKSYGGNIFAGFALGALGGVALLMGIAYFRGLKNRESFKQSLNFFGGSSSSGSYSKMPGAAAGSLNAGPAAFGGDSSYAPPTA